MPQQKEIKEKIIEDVEKGIEWDLKTGKYKNLTEIIQDCKRTYRLLDGGGFYGLNFKDLINYLELKRSTLTNKKSWEK